MRQNAMERDAADADNDGKLDFGEFCQLIRDREEGEHSEAELRKRFDALDEDKSGRVDMSEYLQWSLKDALARSSDRVVDLFRAWDVDRSGSVDKKEFRKVMKGAARADVPSPSPSPSPSSSPSPSPRRSRRLGLISHVPTATRY